MPQNLTDVSAVLLILKETDWLSEKRLMFVLLALYAFMGVCTWLTWHRMNLQAAYFGLLCIGIYAAEHINEWCAENRKLFASKHQYFDSSGMFISIVYSMPVLFNLLVLVISWVKSASSDLIYVKRQEALRKNKERSKKKD